MRYGLLLLLTTLFTAPASAQDQVDGQTAFNNNCRTCHSTDEGDNRLGPHLAGIIGRKAGSLTDYPNYSSAMQQAGITWDEENLDAFIENPEAVVRGNNMKPFAGISDPALRTTIIEFLKSGG